MTRCSRLPLSSDAALRPPGWLRHGAPLLVTLIALVVSGCTGSPTQSRASTPTEARGSSPTETRGSSLPQDGRPIAAVCSDIPKGPAEAPANAVRIDPSVTG